VLLELKGQLYLLGVSLFQYGTYWKINKLTSDFANTKPFARKTALKEYEALISH
jgi:hypothetical protein